MNCPSVDTETTCSTLCALQHIQRTCQTGQRCFPRRILFALGCSFCLRILCIETLPSLRPTASKFGLKEEKSIVDTPECVYIIWTAVFGFISDHIHRNPFPVEPKPVLPYPVARESTFLWFQAKHDTLRRFAQSLSNFQRWCRSACWHIAVGQTLAYEIIRSKQRWNVRMNGVFVLGFPFQPFDAEGLYCETSYARQVVQSFPEHFSFVLHRKASDDR